MTLKSILRYAFTLFALLTLCSSAIAQTQWVVDSLSDTAGTNITAHTGALGATWTSVPAYSSANNFAASASPTGFFRNNSSTNWAVTASGTTATNDDDLSLTFKVGGSSTNGNIGFLVRGDQYYNGYVTRFNFSSNTFVITRNAGGNATTQPTGTTLATSGTLTYSSGTTHTLKVSTRGNVITLYIDGVSRLTATDSSNLYPSAGLIGIGGNGTGNSGDTSGWLIQSLSAQTPPPSFTVSPTSVVQNSTSNTITLTGSYTAWTSSTTFSTTNATITSQSVNYTASPQTALIVITAGNTSGSNNIVVSDNTDAATTPLTTISASAFINDPFSDTAGTSITSHTGTTGATWTNIASFGTGANFVASTSPSGYFRNNTATNFAVLASGSPTGADYDVFFTLLVGGTATNGNQGFLVRSDQYGNGYRLLYSFTGQTWTISKTSGGTATTQYTSTNLKTSGTIAYSNGSSHSLQISLRGSQITLYSDSALVATTADGTYASGGLVGIIGNGTGNGTDTSGWLLKNFIAQLSPPSVQANPTTITQSTAGNIVTLTGSYTSWTSSTTFSATGATITAQSVNYTASPQTATLTLTAGATLGTNNVTLTDSTDSASASVSTVIPMAVFLPNDSHVFWSPGDMYFNSSNYAVCEMNATYFKVGFTGTSIAIRLDISLYRQPAASALTVANWAHWLVSVDGAVPVDVAVADPGGSVNTQTVTLASGLTAGNHTIQAWYDLYSEFDTYTPVLGQTIQAILCDNGASLLAPSGAIALLPKRAMVMGDSITKGYDAATAPYLSPNFPLSIYASVLGKALNAETGVIGLSGQGWTQTVNSWTQLFGQSFGNYDAGHARTFPALDYLVLAEGTNDASNNCTTAAQTLIGTARTACGANTWIIISSPFNGTHASELAAAVAAYKAANPTDNRVLFVNASTVFNISNSGGFFTVDGTHPTALGHAQEGAILANLIQQGIAAASALPARIRRIN